VSVYSAIHRLFCCVVHCIPLYKHIQHGAPHVRDELLQVIGAPHVRDELLQVIVGDVLERGERVLAMLVEGGSVRG